MLLSRNGLWIAHKPDVPIAIAITNSLYKAVMALGSPFYTHNTFYEDKTDSRIRCERISQLNA